MTRKDKLFAITVIGSLILTGGAGVAWLLVGQPRGTWLLAAAALSVPLIALVVFMIYTFVVGVTGLKRRDRFLDALHKEAEAAEGRMEHRHRLRASQDPRLALCDRATAVVQLVSAAFCAIVPWLSPTTEQQFRWVVGVGLGQTVLGIISHLVSPYLPDPTRLGNAKAWAKGTAFTLVMDLVAFAVGHAIRSTSAVGLDAQQVAGSGTLRVLAWIVGALLSAGVLLAGLGAGIEVRKQANEERRGNTVTAVSNRTIVLATMGLMLLALLFPPWTEVTRTGNGHAFYEDGHYGFLLTGPFGHGADEYHVGLGRLFVELIAAMVLGAIARIVTVRRGTKTDGDALSSD